TAGNNLAVPESTPAPFHTRTKGGLASFLTIDGSEFVWFGDDQNGLLLAVTVRVGTRF
uniref:Esterase n=1 Tax=Mesocestoides corti TaxID=53468 RepID=A0A5K3G7Z8_MESCO